MARNNYLLLLLAPPVAVLLLLGAGAWAAPERFDNFKVYSVSIDTDVQSQALDGLWRLTARSLNYWKGTNRVNTVADIMVAPEDQPAFESMLEQKEFKWQTKVTNVQELIDNEQPKNFKPRADGEMDWVSYHTFDEIMAWLDQLLIQYPEILTDVIIGTSVEGRPIRGVKLSRRENNKAILIESNTHAREWITAATATHFLNEMLTSTDTNLLYLSTTFDWIIIPVHNPDGYVYSFESNRMWRKNRSPNGLLCYGVDPNRNWGYQWAASAPGSSNNVCAETYAGTSAMSEPEVKSLADYIAANRDYIEMFLSFHSYSQLMLYPWSYTNEATPNEDLYNELCSVVADAIKKVHGTEYIYHASNALCE